MKVKGKFCDNMEAMAPPRLTPTHS